MNRKQKDRIKTETETLSDFFETETRQRRSKVAFQDRFETETSSLVLKVSTFSHRAQIIWFHTYFRWIN